MGQLPLSGGGTQTVPNSGGFKVSLDAMESLRRQWALELGQHGIRVVTLKTGGIPEAVPDDFPAKAGLADVGDVAAFVASDQGRTLTGTFVNISCGAMLD